MFKRRQPELNGPSPTPDAEPTTGDNVKLPIRGRGEGAPGRAQARRAAEPLGAPRRAEGRAESRERAPSPTATENEGRKLVVGQGIRLSGEIKKCEKLVVEGEVQANLKDCLTLEIAETGLFNGAAIVDEAEISGCFEGELNAKHRLYVRSTGRILGTIRYADLEIERGGKIAGTVDVTESELVEAPIEAEEEAGEPEALGAEEAEDHEAARPSGSPRGANGASDSGGDQRGVRA